MNVTDEMIKAFYAAHDASLEIQPREGHQAVYDGLTAALSKAEPGVGDSENIIAWYGRNGTEWRRKDGRRASQMTTPSEYRPVSSLSLPGKENGETVTPSVDVELRKRVMRAIFDPGATEGFKGDRNLTTWQTDAVMRVMASYGKPAKEADQ